MSSTTVETCTMCFFNSLFLLYLVVRNLMTGSAVDTTVVG
jgi:hypothetical protein